MVALFQGQIQVVSMKWFLFLCAFCIRKKTNVLLFTTVVCLNVFVYHLRWRLQNISCLVVVLHEELMVVFTQSKVFQYSTNLQKTSLIYVHNQWFFRGFIVIFIVFVRHLLIWQATVIFGKLLSLYMLNKVVLTQLIQCKITLNCFAND